MNAVVIRQVLRAILLFLAQVVVFKPLGLGSGWLWRNGDIFIYPLIILLLPIRMSRHYVILLGFGTGLLTDLFYQTPGVHAFALTAVAYARGYALRLFEPRGGYQQHMTPTRRVMGVNWLLSVTLPLIFIHALFYASVEVFTFVFFGKILLKTLVTFSLSMLAIMGYHALFNPRQ
jgi:hypothetical protein